MEHSKQRNGDRSPSDEVIVRVNYRPDVPEPVAPAGSENGWGPQAIALGVVALIVMVVVLVIIIGGALQQGSL